MNEIQIYRISDHPTDGSQLYGEICRDCIERFVSEGKYYEFDGHLCKYVYEKDGVTYYAEGGQDDGTDSEITCSECGEYFLTDKEVLDDYEF